MCDLYMIPKCLNIWHLQFMGMERNFSIKFGYDNIACMPSLSVMLEMPSKSF
jgi:hypothetical protein